MESVFHDYVQSRLSEFNGEFTEKTTPLLLTRNSVNEITQIAFCGFCVFEFLPVRIRNTDRTEDVYELNKESPGELTAFLESLLVHLRELTLKERESVMSGEPSELFSHVIVVWRFGDCVSVSLFNDTLTNPEFRTVYNGIGSIKPRTRLTELLTPDSFRLRSLYTHNRFIPMVFSYESVVLM
jgi:hypothetical protein